MSTDEQVKTLTKDEQISTRTVTKDDMVVLQKQLNKKKMTEPRAVLKRCKWGYPQVTFALSTAQKGVNSAHYKKRAKEGVNYEQEFIPGTLMWLTCPRVRDYVSKLESDLPTFNAIRRHFGIEKEEGSATVLEKADENDLVDLRTSHENYNNWLIEHDELLSYEEFLLWVSANQHRIQHEDDENEEAEEQENPKKRKRVREDVKIEDIQTRFGNAGVSERDSIKCVHAHIGPYMAGVKDLVGEHTYKAATEKVRELEGDIEDLDNALDCKKGCVKCKAYVK
jgi:hypothetical protein